MGAPENPTPLSVTLTMDDATRARLAQAAGIVAVAESFDIDCVENAVLANTELRSYIEREKAIEQAWDGFVKPAEQILDHAKSIFKPARDALKHGQAILKTKLGAWTQREMERVAAEQRAREEADRRARAEAEAKAAAERARAEEAARKAREEARIAEEARQRAEDEAKAARLAGDRKAAAEAERRAQAQAAERAKKEEEERRVREEAERRATQAMLAAATSPAPAPVQAAVPAGFGMRKNWIAELAPGKTEDAAKLEIVKAIAAGRSDLLALLQLDMKSAAKLAKALEAQFNVPGLTARNAPVATSRA